MKILMPLCLLLFASLGFGAAAEESERPDPAGREVHGPMHEGHPGQPGHPGPSIERAAMHRLLVEELARRSGRPVTEIQSLFKDAGPREVARELGLDRDVMHEAMTAARKTLIQRMQTAGLLDAQEAERLRSEEPHWARRREQRRDRGEQMDQRGG